RSYPAAACGATYHWPCAQSCSRRREARQVAAERLENIVRTLKRASFVIAWQRDPLAILAIEQCEFGGYFVAERELARGEIPLRVRPAAGLHFEPEWTPPDEFFRGLIGNCLQQAKHAKRL